MNKKLLSMFAFAILGVALVSAAWVFTYENVIGTSIIGTETDAVIVIGDFEDLVVDTTDGAYLGTSIVDVEADRYMEVTMDLTTTKTNLNPECPNYEDDCTVSVHYFSSMWGWRDVTDRGDYENTFELDKSIISQLKYQVECVPYACSQDIISTIVLTESHTM